MNAFRLLGDFLHLEALVILLLKLWKSKSCTGISGKSQILFAIVFTTRYLDLFTNFISIYNTTMKIIFLTTSYCSVVLFYTKSRRVNDDNHDTFGIEFLVLPAIALALLINYAFDVLEILWTFSTYLESVAILPQLFLICKTGQSGETFYYLLALFSYRILYELNWICRYYKENHHYDRIAIVAGIVQTAIYVLYYFYFYVVKANHRRDSVFHITVPEGDLVNKFIPHGHSNEKEPYEKRAEQKDEQTKELGNLQEKLLAELDCEASLIPGSSDKLEARVKDVAGKVQDHVMVRLDRET